MRGRLMLSALGACALAATAGVVPGAASGTTRYVSQGAGAADTGDCSVAASPCLTIQYAVNQANTGDTVHVARGTYNESVVIDKALVLHGAQFGHDARTARGAESVITGGISYSTPSGGTHSGTVNGFTLDSHGGSALEITASNAGSGWSFIDNIIDVSNGGIYLNTAGQTNPPASTIQQNRFVQFTPSSADSGDFGQAVLLWGNTGNNVTIAKNAFIDLSGPGAAINTTQSGDCGPTVDPAHFGNLLTITGNSLVDSAAAHPGAYGDNFVALFCTTNANVSHNTVTITDASDSSASSPIYLGGGNWSTTVTANRLTGHGANAASGVSFNSDFYASGTGVAITNNIVSGFLYGIHVRAGAYGDQGRGAGNAPSFFTLRGNQVSGSVADPSNPNDPTKGGDGIAVDQGIYGTISRNTVSSSADIDCYDATGPGGPGTAGTYNTWSSDSGTTSSPAGLCH